MLFQSWEYLLLLCVSLIAVRFFKNAVAKKSIILTASILFYTYGSGWQVLLFAVVILMAYAQGLLAEKNKNKSLFCGMLICLFSPLALYKYVPFLLKECFGASVDGILGQWVLPIGISFFTFQAAGYVIDVYRGKIQAEKNIVTFACFISFFPQLVAGPIERCSNLLHQINKFENASKDELSEGFRHILLGLTLKLLVAETMADFVDPVYNNLSGKGGVAILIATFCFGVQIYCDFNGYTQIAIGSAKLMGIDLIQNFNHPYRAVTITDFWRRWHISLTSWFRDYIYFPLGGSRCSNARMLMNTLVVFLLSGIWHGANWTFALWGLANGIAMVLEKTLIGKERPQKYLFVRWLITYVLINLFWVLFRANSLEDACLAYTLIFTDTLPQFLSLDSVSAVVHFLLRENGWSNTVLLPALVGGGLYLWYEYGYLVRKDLTGLLFSRKACVRWIIYAILLTSTLYLGKTLEQSAFVYFRF